MLLPLCPVGPAEHEGAGHNPATVLALLDEHQHLIIICGARSWA